MLVFFVFFIFVKNSDCEDVLELYLYVVGGRVLGCDWDIKVVIFVEVGGVALVCSQFLMMC